MNVFGNSSKQLMQALTANAENETMDYVLQEMQAVLGEEMPEADAVRTYLQDPDKPTELSTAQQIVAMDKLLECAEVNLRKLRTFHGKWERGEMTVADIRSSVESYHGHMKRGNSFKVRENTNQYFKSMFGFYPNKKGWERNVSNSQRWNTSGNGDNPCVGQNAEQRVLRPMHRGTGTRHCDRGVCIPH